MVKYTESKKRPVIITIKTEEKKKEIFQNLQKLRRPIETNKEAKGRITSSNQSD